MNYLSELHIIPFTITSVAFTLIYDCYDQKRHNERHSAKGWGFESLHAYFSQFGAVTDAIVMRKGDGTPRGFGFVTFSSPRVYQQVLALYGIYVSTRSVMLPAAVSCDDAHVPISSARMRSDAQCHACS